MQSGVRHPVLHRPDTATCHRVPQPQGTDAEGARERPSARQGSAPGRMRLPQDPRKEAKHELLPG